MSLWWVLGWVGVVWARGASADDCVACKQGGGDCNTATDSTTTWCECSPGDSGELKIAETCEYAIIVSGASDKDLQMQTQGEDTMANITVRGWGSVSTDSFTTTGSLTFDSVGGFGCSLEDCVWSAGSITITDSKLTLSANVTLKATKTITISGSMLGRDANQRTLTVRAKEGSTWTRNLLADDVPVIDVAEGKSEWYNNWILEPGCGVYTMCLRAGDIYFVSNTTRDLEFYTSGDVHLINNSFVNGSITPSNSETILSCAGNYKDDFGLHNYASCVALEDGVPTFTEFVYKVPEELLSCADPGSCDITALFPDKDSVLLRAGYLGQTREYANPCTEKTYADVGASGGPYAADGLGSLAAWADDDGDCVHDLHDDCPDDPDRFELTAYYVDSDGDGYGTTAQSSCEQASGLATVPGDCNDDDPSVHPGATEVPGDGVDNDCVGGDRDPDPEDSPADSEDTPDPVGLVGPGCACATAPVAWPGTALAAWVAGLVLLRRRR